MRDAKDLLNELNSVDESVVIEAKRASQVGKSVMETVSAFSNEPGLGGGYLLLGVSSKVNDQGDKEYWVEGVPDPDKTQSDLATQCNGMLNQTIRPEMRVDKIGGKPVVVVYVPEVDPRAKPIYLKKLGLPKGAFRRISATDQKCTDDDLYILRDTDGPRQSFDGSVFDDARMEDLAPEAIAEYRRMRREHNPTAEELNLDDEALLEAVGATRQTADGPKPTVAGLLLFGSAAALRRLYPSMRIDYIRIIGNTWNADPDSVQDIRKPLTLAMRQAVNAVLDDLPRGFSLKEGDLQSRQDPVLPIKVLREAIANAVMHRSYRVNEPIQIIRYSNRIEVINPGYSLKNPAELGQPGSRRRNPYIAEVLHDVNLAETKGTGIGRMRRLINEAGLTPPEFTSDRDANTFKAVLHLHHLLTQEDHAWLKTIADPHQPLTDDEAKILVSARNSGTIDNAACRDLTGFDTLNASGLLRRLRDRGFLVKRGAGSQTHYELADPLAFPESAPDAPDLFTPAGDKLSTESPKLGPEGTKLDPEVTKLGLPAPLAAQAQVARHKNLKKLDLRDLVVQICAHQPLTADALASALNKSRPYLLKKHLGEMLEAGQLAYRYPDTPRHPNQQYVAKTSPDNPEGADATG